MKQIVLYHPYGDLCKIDNQWRIYNKYTKSFQYPSEDEVKRLIKHCHCLDKTINLTKLF